MALSVSGGLTDAIAMKLSAPLISGTLYQLSFFQKKDAGYASNPLQVGYSLNDTTTGTVVSTIPAFTSTAWVNYTITFTPTVAAQYVTFYAMPAFYGWNHLDNVQLQIASGINEQQTLNNNWTISQNENQLEINFKNVFKTAVISVYDLQGKLVSEKQTNSCTKTFVDANRFSNVVYFVRVIFDDAAISTKKILLSGK